MKNVSKNFSLVLGVLILALPLSLNAQNGDDHGDENQSEITSYENKRHEHNEHEGHNHSSPRANPKQKKKIERKSKTEATPASKSADANEALPRILVDESNFKSIFDKSIEVQATQVSEETRALEMEVSGRYVGLRELRIPNPYFSVDYMEFMQSMPTVQIGGAKEVWKRGGFAVSPTLSAGYGFKEEKLTVTTKRGTKLVDVVELHVMPLTAGIELKQRLGFIGGTSAFFTPQLGTQWLRQSGTLDGMEQTHWISFYGLRGGLILFQSEAATADGGRWIDGVTVSSTYQNSLSTEQKLSTWSWDLGLRMRL